jgi:hypothetical protein
VQGYEDQSSIHTSISISRPVDESAAAVELMQLVIEMPAVLQRIITHKITTLLLYKTSHNSIITGRAEHITPKQHQL